jgi:cytochrome c553
MQRTRRVPARSALTLAAALICHPFTATAEDAGPQADASKGQGIAARVCAACHGPDGNSTISANPKLAGQVQEYLQKQLSNFKPAHGAKPERENPIMAGMAAPLSPEDVRNVAAFFSQQAPKPGAAKSKEAVELGRKLWRAGDASRGLPACASCHGATGAGVPAQFPRLAGQYAEYTESQLKAFRAGSRSNDSNKTMRTVAGKMTDAEISAVADYAAGLR